MSNHNTTDFKSIFFSTLSLFVAICFNPFYSIVLLCVFSFYTKISDKVFVLVLFFLTFFLVMRPYGINWNETEGDDALNYIKALHLCSNSDYISLIALNNKCGYGTEPGLFLLWVPLFKILDSAITIIFAQIYFSLLVLFYAIRSFNRRFAVLGTCFALIATPNYLPMVIHIFRQMLALDFLLLYLIFKNYRIKIIFIFFAFVSHLTSIFAIPFYLFQKKIELKSLIFLIFFTILFFTVFNLYFFEATSRLDGYSDVQKVSDYYLLIFSWVTIFLFSIYYLDKRYLLIKNFSIFFIIIYSCIVIFDTGLASFSRLTIYFQPLLIGGLAITCAENKISRIRDKMALAGLILIFSKFFISSYIFDYIGGLNGRSFFAMYYTYSFYLDGIAQKILN